MGLLKRIKNYFKNVISLIIMVIANYFKKVIRVIVNYFIKIVSFFLKVIVNLLFKVEINGLEKINFEKPCIIIPNHVSLLEAPLLALNLPDNVYFVVDTGIAAKYPFIEKFRNVIKVDPKSPYSIRTMIREIQDGKSLIIFPEGRITTTGTLMEVFPGVGYIAMKTGIPLYPLGIDGAERSKFSYLGDKLKRHFFPKIKISVGDHFYIDKKDNISTKQQKIEASDKILKKLQSQLTQTRLKENVNLFNELIVSAKINGFKSNICEDEKGLLNYKKLLLNTYVLSNKIDSSLDSTQNVGILLPNVIANVVTLFSLFRIGKTPAMLNFSSGIQTIIDYCETANLKTIITSEQFVKLAKLEKVIAKLEEENYQVLYLEKLKESLSFFDKMKGLIAFKLLKKSKANINDLILFTSGSENKPKGVVLTHSNIFSNIQQARSVIDITQKDILLNSLPMFHSFGLTAGTIMPLLCGAKVFLYPSPLHYKTIPIVAYSKNATILLGTSTFLQGYAKHSMKTSFYSVRYVLAGAEKLKNEVRDLWLKKFGIRIFEGYGATEASPVLSINTPLMNLEGSVGQLLPLMEAKIEAVEGIKEGGNLFVKGPNLMKGYLIHGKGFVPLQDWYDTGDIVEFDNQDYIHIKSRLKRFAKIGGEMISLNLIEEIATKCFGDTDIASVNISDNRKGEKIILFVTNENYKLDKLREFISQNGYSALYNPSKIITIDKIPLLGSGKNDYVTLKKQT